VQVVEASTEADVAGYYPIYCEWSRSKGHVPVPYPLFRETLEVRANRRLFLARHDGATIAGVVVRFCPGGVIEFAANASLKSDQSMRPNDLLHWRIIEWACAQGFVTYSLGGAHLFLRRFGGTVASTYQYRLDRTLGKRLELRDRLAAAARSSWKRLPEPLKRAIRPVYPGAVSGQD
jgi:CelD/BcsL family acetyltransferase involved in cellulose biosynthesis